MRHGDLGEGQAGQVGIAELEDLGTEREFAVVVAHVAEAYERVQEPPGGGPAEPGAGGDFAEAHGLVVGVECPDDRQAALQRLDEIPVAVGILAHCISSFMEVRRTNICAVSAARTHSGVIRTPLTPAEGPPKFAYSTIVRRTYSASTYPASTHFAARSSRGTHGRVGMAGQDLPRWLDDGRRRGRGGR